MDYSKMTDFEINKLVSELLSIDCCTRIDFSGESIGGQAKKWLCRYEEGTRFDPCNNPADAWPIITENNISIILDNPTMPCATANSRDLFDDEDPIASVVYDNPLRAAMIVYLMMQEAK